MIKRYGDNNTKRLYIPETPGIIPRQTRYGDDDAYRLGLTPIEYADSVNVLDWNDVKEALQKSHDDRSQPMYHQVDTWAPEGFKYNQNGIGYCWTWSGTACMMDCRASEAKETTILSPVSMGWLVNWKDRGNYLGSYIKGARETGVAPASYIPGGINSHLRKPNEFQDGWEDARASFKLNEVWDTNTRNGDRQVIQQCATILVKGKPIYIAYNWWGHALELVGMEWDESEKNNVVWKIRNSHNEDDLIELTGDKGVPDEAYGFVSTILA